MECASCLAVHQVSWLPILIPSSSAIGNNSSTEATSQCGGNQFRTATCTSTKVSVTYELPGNE